MVLAGMVQCVAGHGELARDLASRRRCMRDTIALTLSRWLDGPAARAQAGYLAAVLQGLSIQARDGAGRKELQGVADEAVAGLRARRSAAAG